MRANAVAFKNSSVGVVGFIHPELVPVLMVMNRAKSARSGAGLARGADGRTLPKEAPAVVSSAAVRSSWSSWRRRAIVSKPERVATKARRSLDPCPRRRRGRARNTRHASGGLEAQGRKDAACRHGCRLAESLGGRRRALIAASDRRADHSACDSNLSSKPCDSILSSKMYVGAMRM